MQLGVAVLPASRCAGSFLKIGNPLGTLVEYSAMPLQLQNGLNRVPFAGIDNNYGHAMAMANKPKEQRSLKRC